MQSCWWVNSWAVSMLQIVGHCIAPFDSSSKPSAFWASLQSCAAAPKHRIATTDATLKQLPSPASLSKVWRIEKDSHSIHCKLFSSKPMPACSICWKGRRELHFGTIDVLRSLSYGCFALWPFLACAGSYARCLSYFIFLRIIIQASGRNPPPVHS